MSWRIGAFLLFLAAVSGCADNTPGPPPLEISFRKSQIPLKGMVIGIKNASETELTVISVSVRSVDEEGTRSHVVKTPIESKDSITIGWVELDGWKLKPGDEVTIQCKGYDTPKKVKIPKL